MRTVLFLCTDKIESQTAQILFEAEAQRMELPWVALAKTFAQNSSSEGASDLAAVLALDLEGDLNLPKPVTIADLQKSDLVIVLHRASQSLMQEEFPGWKGEIEHWQINSALDAGKTIWPNITNLVVRLILKGGKRPPVETTAAKQTVNTSLKNSSANAAAKNSAVRVSLDSKARRGKKVTVVSGLPLDEAAMEVLAAALKQSCGSGGTVKDGQIEIQGDHRDRIMAQLQERGYKPKRSGG
jgi:predicted translation initiation factor SUI1